jgi:sphinganine-1-phosphate aldolase
VVDPIEDLALLCRQRKIGLHVDNCLGGFWLSFMQQQGLGRKFKWDFEVEGVTTISIDIHKYGCASKGASVIAFRDPSLRRASYVPVKDGNTLYITPTLQGARSGAVIAAAWGTIIHIGRDGYLRLSRRLHELHSRLKDVVRQTKGIRLLCDSDLSIVPIASDDPSINIYALATLLDKRGWNTFTSGKPAAMAICIGERHEEVLDLWVTDLEECMAELWANPNVKLEGDSAVYGTADLLPDQILNDVLKSYVDVKLTVKPKPT